MPLPTTLSRIVLALSLAAIPFGAWPLLRPRIEDVPGQVRRLGETTPFQRECRTLDAPVRGVFEAAELVAPLFEGAGYQDVGLLVLAAGGAAPPYPAIHGQVLLQYHFAPRARTRGWPLDLLERSLQGEGPSRPDPFLLQSLDGALVGLAIDVPSARIDALIALAERQFGVPVIHRGRSLGDRHHVLLIGDVADRAASGDPAFAPYRKLSR